MTPVASPCLGDAEPTALLRSALEELGCVVLPRKAVGVPGFAASTAASGWGRHGMERNGPSRRSGSALVSLIELENGGGRVALPAGAPEAVRALAAVRGGEVPAWTGTVRKRRRSMPPFLAAGRDLRRSPAVCPSGPDGGTALHAGGAGPQICGSPAGRSPPAEPGRGHAGPG